MRILDDTFTSTATLAKNLTYGVPTSDPLPSGNLFVLLAKAIGAQGIMVVSQHMEEWHIENVESPVLPSALESYRNANIPRGDPALETVILKGLPHFSESEDDIPQNSFLKGLGVAPCLIVPVQISEGSHFVIIIMNKTAARPKFEYCEGEICREFVRLLSSYAPQDPFQPSIVGQILDFLKSWNPDIPAEIKQWRHDIFKAELAGIVPNFQPIVHLVPRPEIYGYEALARVGTDSQAPGYIFGIAELWGKEFTYCLDTECVKRSTEIFASYLEQGPAQPSKLFVNVYPSTLANPNFRSVLNDLIFQDLTILSENIVFEISEKQDVPTLKESDRTEVAKLKSFRDLLISYKNIGVQFAIDDFGAKYANCLRMAILSPTYVKIDRDVFVQHHGGEQTVRYVSDLLDEYHGKTIVEGIEEGRTDQLAIAYKFGARFGQGYFFGKPSKELLPVLPSEVARPIKEMACAAENITILPTKSRTGVTVVPSKLESSPGLANRTIVTVSHGKKEESVSREPHQVPTSFTWLHISDLHLENTPQRVYQIKQVISALREDLTRLEEDQRIKPDVIFFTGDLAHSAKPIEYRFAIEECLKPILESCKLGYRDLFIVPGNHDVDRSKATDLDASLLQTISDASSVYAVLRDPGYKGYGEQLTKRMAGWTHTVGAIVEAPYDVGALSWGRVLETKDKKKIGIIGLNSVWTSASIKGLDGQIDDQGKLVVGKPLVDEAWEQIEQKQSTPDVCIALMHHPLDWLQSWDQKDIRQMLRETCQFLLHGHVHETTIDFLGAPNPSTMVISAGALFKKYERGDVYSCLHAYNIVQLDLAKHKGIIYFRRFDPVHQRYGTDDTTFKDVRGGRYSFRYGKGGFTSDSGPN